MRAKFNVPEGGTVKIDGSKLEIHDAKGEELFSGDLAPPRQPVYREVPGAHGPAADTTESPARTRSAALEHSGADDGEKLGLS